MPDQVWTDEQFDEMSWHDNCVHALRIVEGIHGAGELILDLDYILEWIEAEESFRFRILSVTLKFREVTDLRISLDYATPTIALGPFSIHAIERKIVQRERYVAQVWTRVVLHACAHGRRRHGQQVAQGHGLAVEQKAG